jgi:peptidoglycan/xylan/chitin deacetylase (PgdA/CDA1 family)
VPAKLRLNFERQMDALQRGARVIPATFRGYLPSGKKHVAITFDDAFDSLLENALPGLSARSFHATIFVPVGWMGGHPTWETDEEVLEADDVVMTIEQLKKLNSSVVSLGAHTLSHPLLSKLDKRQLRDEIEGSRNRLVELSGQDIRSFSFPYGDYNASCVEACKAAGYDTAFSILPEEVDTASPKMLRGRTRVDPSDGPIEFFLKFNGGYVWASQIAPLARKLRSVMSLK